MPWQYLTAERKLEGRLFLGLKGKQWGFQTTASE